MTTVSAKLINRLRHPKHPLSPTRISRTITLGLKSLWNHRLRSLLTVLGIVFGVCSVIAMLAIGEGASYEAQEQIRRLGSNNILIRAVKPPEEMKSTSEQSRMAEYGLTYADVDRIRETIPGVDIEVPGRIIRKDVWSGSRRVDCDVYGTVPSFENVSPHPLVAGRFFTKIEQDEKANVCVIDQGMAEKLFPMDDPIGRQVHVGELYFKIVGIVETTGPASGEKGDKAPQEGKRESTGAPHRMLIPLATERERFGEIVAEARTGSISFERVELHEVIVKVSKTEYVLDVAHVVEAVLEKNHKKKDYEITVPLELLRQAERTKQIFNVVLGGIAAISLLVGGIGIMNIMLASVTERTREIGIRRALGAKRRDIVIQFLVETVLLSGAGGLIGVGLGLAIPFFIGKFAGMKTIVTPASPILAFSISGLVGIIFGIYPAMRAANMDPVEALRHE